MKKLLLGLTLLASLSTFANEISYPAIFANKVEQKKVTFKYCFDVNDCKFLGDENGNDLSKLDFNIKSEKAHSIFRGFINTSLILAGAYSTIIVTPAGSALILGGIIANIATLNKTLGGTPSKQYFKVNLKSKVHMKKFEDVDSIIFESSDRLNIGELAYIIEDALAQ